MKDTSNTIAVVGAGMAGLTCANELAKAGFAPVLFDKGRGPGGRMAARRAEVAGETVSFDHGAQVLTAETPEFAAQLSAWEAEGAAALWAAAGEGAYIGTPGMNGPIRTMAETLDVRWGVRIETLQRDGDVWLLGHDGGQERFDHVICAIPAEQASVLLADAAPEYAAQAKSIISTPCWALMAAFDTALDLPDTVEGTETDAIHWAARNSAKPQRAGSECWVIHASADFSRQILEHSKDGAANALLDAFAQQTGVSLPDPIHTAAHRWLYAFPQVGEGAAGHLWNADAGLGVCGDWLHGPRAENAFLSGRALAAAILA
ncbi:MAG: FAD-dependent oxidoreductase [Marinomonas sp.]